MPVQGAPEPLLATLKKLGATVLYIKLPIGNELLFVPLPNWLRVMNLSY